MVVLDPALVRVAFVFRWWVRLLEGKVSRQAVQALRRVPPQAIFQGMGRGGRAEERPSDRSVKKKCSAEASNQTCKDVGPETNFLSRAIAVETSCKLVLGRKIHWQSPRSGQGITVFQKVTL